MEEQAGRGRGENLGVRWQAGRGRGWRGRGEQAGKGKEI